MEDIKSEVKALQDEIALKDKEIALLINHCDTLIQQSNTLKLLNDFDSLIDENNYLYDYIDQLNKKCQVHEDELKEFTTNMEEINLLNNNEQEKLTKLLYCKEETINILTNRYGHSKKFIEEQQELIKKQNDELIDLNFVIYNQNKEMQDLQARSYLIEREEEIEKLKKQVNEYTCLINEIKNFIAAQQSQYPLFNPSKIMDNLMILFNEKILCYDDSPKYNNKIVQEIPKNKKMKKKLLNRS